MQARDKERKPAEEREGERERERVKEWAIERTSESEREMVSDRERKRNREGERENEVNYFQKHCSLLPFGSELNTYCTSKYYLATDKSDR